MMRGHRSHAVLRSCASCSCMNLHRGSAKLITWDVRHLLAPLQHDGKKPRVPAWQEAVTSSCRQLSSDST